MEKEHWIRRADIERKLRDVNRVGEVVTSPCEREVFAQYGNQPGAMAPGDESKGLSGVARHLHCTTIARCTHEDRTERRWQRRRGPPRRDGGRGENAQRFTDHDLRYHYCVWDAENSSVLCAVTGASV